MNETITINETSVVETGKTITVTVYYRLSEQGQRAALLAGLPAQSEQSITGPVPVSGLDLCGITPEGEVISPANYRGGAPRWDLDAVPSSAAEALISMRRDLEARKSEQERLSLERRRRDAGTERNR
jgi:hypothetical protein